MQKQVYILDFGSQYTQLIARKVRELNIYCEIVPFNKVTEIVDNAAALILSGSPFSCIDKAALNIDLDLFVGKIPTLGICYGAQYIADRLGGEVGQSNKREYGKAALKIVKKDPLLEGISENSQIWMSHGDSIKVLPDHAEILATTETIPVAAYKVVSNGIGIYGIQFHPEVAHSLEGIKVIGNFLINIAGVEPTWTPASYVDESIATLKHQMPSGDILLALSGGVDSTVAAILVNRAVGERLHCVFVDNGLLRKGEYDEVLAIYKRLGLNIHAVDAKQRFWDALAGVSDPETKRKIIGRLFIEIFEEFAETRPAIDYLGQGTIYPDVIESVSVKGPSVTIKSHHNVGGLPDKLKLKVIEPLRSLFKDEVRRVGTALGIPENILQRHPFPGPGLAIRILGDITEQRVKLLQEADFIYISKLKAHGLYDKIWQAGAILLPIYSVGVMGDERTYEQVVALRAVNSSDGMTAEWSPIPHEILADISTSIINQVKGINRVVYDISTKPPSTIEWE